MAHIRVLNDGAVIDSPGEDLNPWAGRPGSILSRLLGQGYLMAHVCGGQLACGTCHIYVRAGRAQTSPVQPEEQEWLETLAQVQECSRLACQCVIPANAMVDVELVEPDRRPAQSSVEPKDSLPVVGNAVGIPLPPQPTKSK